MIPEKENVSSTDKFDTMSNTKIVKTSYPSIPTEFNDPELLQLADSIANIVQNAVAEIATHINMTMTITYWRIGQHIVEFEQHGKARAKYGVSLLANLSKILSIKLGKGYSRPNLNNMRKFYLLYPSYENISTKLTWTHICELIKIDDNLERSFYENECITGHWNVKQLQRQMDSGLFMRLALSKDKEGVLQLAHEGVKDTDIQKPEDVVRSSYVVEFLGLSSKKRINEKDLQRLLCEHMKTFLLELGKGFMFQQEQYGMTINNRHYHVDLLFYHRILRCHVLIDLKRGEVKHRDIGQMNLYLGYFAKEEMLEGENPPIGILLGRYKDDLMVEYATYGMDTNLFVSKYELLLPNIEELRAMVRRITE